MASIARRPDGNWRARYRDASGREHSKQFARKIDARHWLDNVAVSMQSGTWVDPDRAKMTVGQLADLWIQTKVNLKPTTTAVYMSVLEVHLRPRWGATPLLKVEHGHVQAWVADLSKRGLSAGHVRKAHGVLLGVLALAVRDRRIPSNPAAGVSLPRVTAPRRKYLTAQQVHALAKAAGPAGREVVYTLAYCGLRWSELAGLRVGRVDLQRCRLDIVEAMTEVNGATLIFGTPKNHERRSVPIPKFWRPN